MTPMDAPAPPPETGRRRPFALLILIGLMVFKGVLILLMIMSVIGGWDVTIFRALRIESLATGVRESRLVLVALLVIAALLFIAAAGMLAGRRSGWLLAMVTTGVFVAVDIMGYIAGTANYLWMALNIVTVFYLNQREVRDSVGEGLDDASEPARQAVTR